jgi:hypothetical protein
MRKPCRVSDVPLHPRRSSAYWHGDPVLPLFVGVALYIRVFFLHSVYVLGEVAEEETLYHSAADLVIHLRSVRIPETSVCAEDRSVLIGLYQYLNN